MASIVIEDWMIEDEGLSGVQLLAFALIYGCTQKGDGCWYGGYDKLAKRVGATSRGIIKGVNALVEAGKIERCDGVIDGKVRKVLRSRTERSSREQSSQEEVNKVHSLGEQSSYPSNNKEKEIENKEPEFSQEVEELYAMYPSRCPKRGRSTDKGKNSKKIIVRLLKTFSSQDIAATIRAYLDECDRTDTFIKNFDTLLHKIERGEIKGDAYKPQQQEHVVYYRSLEEREAARKARKQ